MSKNNEFNKKNENVSDTKFVFVDEGAADGVYSEENEQTVSVGDDVFYQDLAQDVLENNVQSKLAKDDDTAEESEGFDDADGNDIPDVNNQFVEEAEDSDDDVIEISVASGAYGNGFVNADSADEAEEIADFDEEAEDAEDFDEEAEDTEDFDEEAEDAEDFDEEAEDVEDFNEEAEDVEDFDEEAEDVPDFDEEIEGPEDFDEEAEDVPDFDEEIEDPEDFDEEAEDVPDFDEEIEDPYSVGEAEPAAAGKVDLMGFLSDEALSEINSSFGGNGSDGADMDMTQVYDPVSASGSESGYVDIDDTDDYEDVPRSGKTQTRRKKKRGSFKGVAQIVSLLIVVAGLTWLISRVAFSAMGSSDKDNQTSSDLLYGYSSNVSVVSFDDSSDDDTSSEEEFNVVSLSVGDKSDLVLKVQRALSSLGYLEYAQVRGTYDNATKTAVTEFQKANNITATGVVDKVTYYALFDSKAATPTTVTTELPSTTTAEETTTTTGSETTTTETTTATNATTAHTTIKTTSATEKTTKKTTTTTEKTTKKTTTTTTKRTRLTTTTTMTTEPTTKKTTTTTEPTTKKTTTTTEPTTKKTTTTEPTTTTSTTTAKPTTTTTTEATLPSATSFSRPITTKTEATTHTTFPDVPSGEVD